MSKVSYSQIFRASSITGGSQGITLLIGMVRMKLVAVLIGPSGVGLIGLYLSITGLMSTITGFGVSNSAVREIAKLRSADDLEGLSRAVQALRRIAWVTGTLGWCLTAVLAWPLSIQILGSGDYTIALACLGATVLFGAATGSQSALLQGTQRIGDLARTNVWAALIGTVIAVGLYLLLGVRGIVPVLILLALVQYGCTWWYARRVVLQPVLSRWSETWAHFRIFGRVGFAFMWSALLAAVVGLLIRGVIVRDFGLEANGVYQAALTLANMFGAFILSAMSIDYYPRLSAVASDHPVANRSVNEQIEVGVLLALPGLVGTLAFAGLLMQLFYTKAFLEGAALLPWLCVGVFAKVVLWPVGMISQAKGASRWMVISQTHANVVSLAVSLGMMAVFGLRGVAYAVPLVAIWHGSLSIWIGHRLSGFWFSKAVLKLVGIGFVFIVCAMLLPLLPSALQRLGVGAALTLVAAVVSLRGIARRLGEQHRIVMLVCRLPGGRFICGL